MGRFVPWDVVSLGTFCPLLRFVLCSVAEPEPVGAGVKM